MGLRAPALVAGALVTLALASVGCPPVRKHAPPKTTGEPIYDVALDSKLASERARAAFELGQLGNAWVPAPRGWRAHAERRLVERSYKERDANVRGEIVAALGRVGQRDGRDALLRELELPSGARARAGWALAVLYRRLRDHDLDPATDVERLSRVLVGADADVRVAVTDALAETKRDAARPSLLHQLADADGLVRARAARGLLGFAREEDVPLLAPLLGDADERAAVAAAQALATLGEHGSRAAIAVLAQAMETPRALVLVGLSQLPLRRAELAPMFAVAGRKLAGDDDCIAAFLHDRAAARVDLVKACGVLDETAREKLVARVLEGCDPALALGAVDTLLAIPTTDAGVRAFVAEALGRYDDPRAKKRVLEWLTDPDSVVRAAASEVAAAHVWGEAGVAIARALPTPPLTSDDTDAAITIVAALATLHPAGAAAKVRALLDGTVEGIALAAREAIDRLEPSVPHLVHPIVPRGPFDELALASPAPRVRLRTSRGDIVIELDPARAPKNARNFLGLVRRGFYDGLRFHRVVPGFVAQGGDPRGDGSGGAGHLVACERNAAPYVEGTVGMALSGPDTGSSQFFITLAPAPHLEGRYTAFGRVIEGMPVARALRPDDRITSAREEN